MDAFYLTVQKAICLELYFLLHLNSAHYQVASAEAPVTHPADGRIGFCVLFRFKAFRSIF